MEKINYKKKYGQNFLYDENIDWSAFTENNIDTLQYKTEKKSLQFLKIERQKKQKQKKLL